MFKYLATAAAVGAACLAVYVQHFPLSEGFVKWDSQDRREWAAKHAHAAGKYVQLEVGEVHYLDLGSKDKPVLVMLHGMIWDHFMWSRQHVFAETHRVIIMDLMGQGFSERLPLEKYQLGYDLYAEQLRQLLAHLGIKKASLMGQSMGGGTVVHFASMYPEMVESLVLVNNAGWPQPMPPLARAAALPYLGEFLALSHHDMILKHVLADNFLYDRQLVEDNYDEITMHRKIEGTGITGLELLRVGFVDTIAKSYEKVGREARFPILITFGRQDGSLNPAMVPAMHAALGPKARLEWFDKASHVVNFEYPEKFNAIVGEFLDEVHRS